MTPSSTRRLYRLIAGFGFALVIPATLPAQCTGPTTVHLAVHHLTRESSNSIDALAGTQTVGDYWETWDSWASSVERVGGVVLHTGSNGPNDYGDIAAVEWHSAPSEVGPGTFSTSNEHKATSMCGNSTSYSSNDTLNVQQPTISGIWGDGGIWYLGPNTPDAVLAQNGSYYYQLFSLTFNHNCGPLDTCNDTPQWSLDSSGNKATLSSYTGTAVTLHTADYGICQYDTGVSASIGGFQSPEYAVRVNSPEAVVSQSYLDETVQWPGQPTGYESHVHWAVGDACTPENHIPGLPIYETFGMFSNPGVIRGWPDPPATSSSQFNYPSNETVFYDAIGAMGSGNDPVPTFTSSGPPFSYNTVLKYGLQSWFVGSTNQNSGAQVFSGTISYYRDHGKSQ